ncbi:MAG: intradiol ring-cleavage dioxygenase [Clostridia bacterium]
MILTRRRLIAASLLPLLPKVSLAQTPACGAPTEPETAGPFFKTDSPLRTSLREADAKTTLWVSGRVLGSGCKPIANAKLDFWHADEHGLYSSGKTYRYRGHQFTDAQGRFRLETVRPAEYPGRTRHIHVKVQPPGGRTLTTQLYFPGEGLNRVDPLYRKDLEMALENGERGSFDFVVA